MSPPERAAHPRCSATESLLTLSRDPEDGALRAIRDVRREDLLASDIIVTNFHALGTGDDDDDLLCKLLPGDVDLLVVDEAHIAAAESYQRAFAHFSDARALLMSACFQRLDGKPIDADVVYSRTGSLIPSRMEARRTFASSGSRRSSAQTTYEMVCMAPMGVERKFEVATQSSICSKTTKKLARVTAKVARAHPTGDASRPSSRLISRRELF